MRSSAIILIASFVLLVASGGFQATPQKTAVTFSADIAPIVFNKCASCHRPGEAAPFSLLSFEDVQKRGKLIAFVTKSRYMPPWHGDSEMAAFRDDRRLTDEEIRTIQEWLQAGMPQGDPAKTPAPPNFTPGWQLGQPDLVVRMKEPFEIPADGPDIFRNFALKLDLKEDKWVKAIEFRSSANSSHHALFFLDQTGTAIQLDGRDGHPGFRGMSFIGNTNGGRGGAGLLGGLRGGGTRTTQAGLGGWAVGGRARMLPDGLARSLPKDSDLILQMHFHPSGKVEREQATVGFYFAAGPPKRTLETLQIPPLFGALAGINIPAGEKRFVIKDSFTLPIDVDVIGGGGHAHYLSTDMRMTATLPGGQKQELLGIPDWWFNWQEGYSFSEPIRLPKGTQLDVQIAYDNSSANPNNPSDPPKRVTFGQQSTDEMGAMTIELVPVNESDLPVFRSAIASHLQDSVRGILTDFLGGHRGR